MNNYLKQFFITLLLIWGAAPTAVAETYIIPIWATASPASDGTWWARAVATNPHNFPVSYRVTGVFPLTSTRCDECINFLPTVTLEPGATVPLHPGGLAGERMIAGAFEIDATATLAIDLVAYRAGRTELRQRLDVARRWLEAGRHTINAVERAGSDWRMNVFLTNPGNEAVPVSVWSGRREENEIRIVVPARRTALVSLPPPLCNGVPCPFPTDYPPFPIKIEVDSAGELLSSASAVTQHWAVFSLPPAATHE